MAQWLGTGWARGEDASAGTGTAPAVESRPAGSVADFLGIWRLVDQSNQPFILQIASDGSACAIGGTTEQLDLKKGRWRLEGQSLVITYNSGWSDVLMPREDRILQATFAPGQSLDERPRCRAPAVRLESPNGSVSQQAKAPSRQRGYYLFTDATR